MSEQNSTWLSRQASVWWPSPVAALPGQPGIDSQQGQRDDGMPADFKPRTLPPETMAYAVNPSTVLQCVCCEPQQPSNAPEDINETPMATAAKLLLEQFSDISEPCDGEGKMAEEGHNELPKPSRSYPPEGEKMMIEDILVALDQYHPSSTKRRKNAYSFYIHSFCDEYKALHPDGPPINLCELSSEFSARWRNMPEERRREFNEMAAKHRRLFRSLPRAPKRPTSGYKFFKTERANVSVQHPEYRLRDVLGTVSSMWRSLDGEAKSVYQKEASLAKRKYENELTDYILSNLNDTEPLAAQLKLLSRAAGRTHFPSSVLCAVMIARGLKPRAEVQG